MAALVAALLAGCSTAPAASPGAPPATPSLAPLTASPVPSPTSGARVLPGAQTPVEPGMYRWDGFEPAIELEVGRGWSVGHRHDEYFDLFWGETFPAIGFGRFAGVIGGGGPVPARDVEAVIAALRSNPDLVTGDVGPASLAGLSGQTIDLRATKEQTPVFQAAGGDVHTDPGFVIRYHLLDVQGGVLLVAIYAEDGKLDAALTLAGPVLESLRIVG